MKKVIIILMSLVIVICLSSCATTKGFQQVCDSWIGAPETELIRLWGYPQNTLQLQNGNTVYVYSSGGTFTMPSHYDTSEDVWGKTQVHITEGTTITLWCCTYFEIDEQGIIINYRFEGNNCVAREE